MRDRWELTTDGPIAETRLRPVGVQLIEARNLDAALQVGARIPRACHGSIEVRPLGDLRGVRGTPNPLRGDRS